MPDPDELVRLTLLVVLVLLLGLVALGIVLALIAAWRNVARREKLLEQGRRLRARHREAGGERPPSTDAWRMAGERLEVELEDEDDEDRPGDGHDPPDDEDDDDDDDEGDELRRRRL